MAAIMGSLSAKDLTIPIATHPRRRPSSPHTSRGRAWPFSGCPAVDTAIKNCCLSGRGSGRGGGGGATARPGTSLTHVLVTLRRSRRQDQRSAEQRQGD